MTKRHSYLKTHLLASLLAIGAPQAASAQDVSIDTGTFEQDWNNLGDWTCPEWFKDAKFGIWAHWGPQCQAEDGDWYARGMYFESNGQYNYHVQHYGDPAKFGFKDVINEWKADKWDPEKLIALYKSVGARYFMTLGQHHDNFDLWNSPYQEWNSVNMGPKRDIVKGWSDACKKYGLPLGVSMHGSHAWTWYEGAQDYDGNLTKEDGKGLWWEGYDPQELYAQRHTPSVGYENEGNIHSQWDWGNGASQPSEAYKMKFQNRVLECINDYNPDMLYFDDTVLPFWGCDEQVGLNILTHYYNHSAKLHDGQQQVVVMGKKLEKKHKKAMLWDVERGIPDRPQDEYWQTCTCIGSWHYDRNTYNNGYKSAQQVVDMLVDIVSKNGNLLLSIPIRGNGTIDEKEEEVLAGIKAWMDINAKSIYGTRPWKTFGEGPLAEASNPLNSQGFNEKNNYSAKDVRYVERNDTVYATIMRWPSSRTFTFAALGMGADSYSGKVKSIELLGYGPVDCTSGVDGMTVTLPEKPTNDIAPVFQLVFDHTSVTLAEIIEGYEAKALEMKATAGTNTGKYNAKAIDSFLAEVESAKSYINDTDENQKVIINTLAKSFKKLKDNGTNTAGEPKTGYIEDQTADQLVEAKNFTASTIGSRFGTPENWTVENFDIPEKDNTKGNKNGIDSYPGFNCLALGVWKSEDVTPYTCDLANARIYRKVHLEPGTYYFGAKKESGYNLWEQAYIFAATDLCTTEQLTSQALAFAPVNAAPTDGRLYGITFKVDEARDILLGFQADMANGPTEQEFRLKEVTLLYYGNRDEAALQNLIEQGADILDHAVVNSNTGFYKTEAADKLQKAIDEAMSIDSDASYEQFAQACENLESAIDDFQKNGINVGGTPIESGAEDLTADKLHEASNFSRTPETDNGERFSKPLYWTVENFDNGLDNHEGPDCLHLEVWWNSSSFSANGYDIHNARIYQKTTLPEGRYFFGAAYAASEPNEDMYIFASTRPLDTSRIPSDAIAFEKVNKAPTDGSFRGIYFTLDKETEVCLGFQSDFSNVQTANFRAREVKLLSYGQISHEKLLGLIASIEEAVADIKVNENTGFYSTAAFEQLLTAINTARATPSNADPSAVIAAYNLLNEQYNDFLTNGKNAGGQADELSCKDLTETYLKEKEEFSRRDPQVVTRFSAPAYWTVENFCIDKGGEGIKGGLDKYPGKDCLNLGLWDDRDKNTEGDLTDARIYQTVHLPAGRYYFGAAYETIYNISDQAYIFAADAPLPSADIQTRSIAYYPINKAVEKDGNTYGIYFTLEQEQDLILGFQANLMLGSGQQEFRATSVRLLQYNKTVGIESAQDDSTDTPASYYSLTGMRLKQEPQHGLYIMKQGKKAVKRYRK